MTRRRSAAVVLAAVFLAAAGSAAGGATAAADGPEPDGSALVGGSGVAQGVFVTYSDKETVIEGGTVVPPDATVAQAEAGVDLTGRARALAAPVYSPYTEAAGLLNAFAGTELPFGELSERSRAKVSGSPPQEAHAPMPGERPAGRARARIADGPRAEADTVALDGTAGGAAVAVGRSHAVVDAGAGAADTTVTVVLRQVAVGNDLVIDTVRLSVRAVADGGGGVASASSVVEGVTLAGRPVRITPRGLEPVGGVPGGGGAAGGSGIEVVATGSETAEAGGDQSEAAATGPRLRLSSADGRVLEVVVGRAAASSSRVPAGDGHDQAGAAWPATPATPGPRGRADAARLST